MSVSLAVVALLTSASLELDWSAPDGCPSAEVVRARLGAVTGRATARLTERSSGWLLQLRVDETTRELTSHTCEEATEAAVLILRLALPPSDAKVEEAAAPTVATSPSERPPPSEPLPPRWSFHLSLSGGLNAGFLPFVLGRVGLGFAAERASLVLMLALNTALPQRYEGGPTTTAAVVLHQLVDAQAGACWVFAVGALKAGPCLSAGASALLVQGVNVVDPKSTVVLVPEGGPGVRATVRLTDWLEVVASAWGRASARPSVSFEGYQPVVTASWASAELNLGLGGVF